MFLPHFVSVFLETGCLEQNTSLPLLHTEFHASSQPAGGFFYATLCQQHVGYCGVLQSTIPNKTACLKYKSIN